MFLPDDQFHAFQLFEDFPDGVLADVANSHDGRCRRMALAIFPGSAAEVAANPEFV